MNDEAQKVIDWWDNDWVPRWANQLRGILAEIHAQAGEDAEDDGPDSCPRLSP